MRDMHWLVIVWSLLGGSWLAWPYIDATRSVSGALACIVVTAFGAGIIFRGIVDGLARREPGAVPDEIEEP